MFYQNKHWLSLDDVDIISEDWAFYNMWYAKRMLERQAGLCKLSCFGFVTLMTHYEVYHWTKLHLDNQPIKELAFKFKTTIDIQNRIIEAHELCKGIVTKFRGVESCDEIRVWAHRHILQQVYIQVAYEMDMDLFFSERITEREHEKEHLCSYRLENHFIPKGDERCLPKVREWGQKHLEKQNLLSLGSGSSDNIGNV